MKIRFSIEVTINSLCFTKDTFEVRNIYQNAYVCGKRGCKNMMNIGLVGCGRVAHLHMCAYKHIPEANVVAISDINLEKAKAFAQSYGIKKALKDKIELFEMKDLDFVDICTPTSTHVEIACEAARFGHNILLEKPMARSTSDCDEIIQEISENKVKLCICHNQLFIPQVIQAKHLVDSREFDLIYFGVSVVESAELMGAPSWITTPEEGGILWETGCHSAYLQLHFLNDIDEVYAIGSKVKHSVHDDFSVLLRTADQTYGVMRVSWLARTPEVTFDLASSDGKRLQILDYSYLLEIPEKTTRSILRGFYLDQKIIVKKWIKSAMENLRQRDLARCLHHYNLISEYIQSIKNDSDPPVKPEDGRRTIKLLECIEESLNKNQPVRMENTTH
jgi:predicted dehydrogenase